MSKSRLFYVDNLRIVLISLVVLHHLAITYGAPGGWYYNESQADFPIVIPMSMFVATNQSFFMGLFFLISAFFTAASIKRKSTGTFIKDRIIRLGIPLFVFYFILSPLTNFIRNRFIYDDKTSFGEFLTTPGEWGFGPMWFVEALLIFTLLFLLLNPLKIRLKIKFPETGKILLAAILIGLIQFIIRIWLPVGWSLPHTGLQFPFFIQYIFLFIIGVVAFQNKWLELITLRTSLRWFIFAQIMILIVLPVVMYFGGMETGVESFMGGITWQSFAYAVWEQLVGISLIIGLFGIFKNYLTKQGKLAKKLSDSAYGVFVFHPPILLGISALFLNFEIPQLLKFIVLAPVALTACFLVAWLIKQIPVFNKVI